MAACNLSLQRPFLALAKLDGGSLEFFESALRRCLRTKNLTETKRLHSEIINNGYARALDSLLLLVYGKCGSITDARTVFEKMPEKKAGAWNVMISAHAQMGRSKEALNIYDKMDVAPDSHVYSSVLGVCAKLKALSKGKAVHTRLTEEYEQFKTDNFVQNALLNMYAKCGSIGNAEEVFSDIINKDRVSWNVMITAYVQQGYSGAAINLFRRMDLEGISPDCVTFTSIFGAFANTGALAQGKANYKRLLDMGLKTDDFVHNALINMFSKCCSIGDARRVFDRMQNKNLISWTTLIGAYTQHGHGLQAVELYKEMISHGIEPNCITLSAVIAACSSAGALEEGKKIHSNIISRKFPSDMILLTALVDMYAKCGFMDEAKNVFDKIEKKDVVCWNAMVSGYAQHGQWQHAIEIFKKMDIEADSTTYASVLAACSSMGALTEGRAVHNRMKASRFNFDVTVSNGLVNMYAKCGSMDDALLLFIDSKLRNIVTWTALVAGYAENKRGKDAVELYWLMNFEGITPDRTALLSILAACSHSGLLDEGLLFFRSMSSDYWVELNAEHYACMIDLLSRAGRLEQAEGLIEDMPFYPNVVAWKSFLGSCKVNGDVNRANHAAQRIVELDPCQTAPYVVLSNIASANHLTSSQGAMTMNQSEN